MSDIFSRLRDAYRVKDDVVPRGYLSRKQWQARLGLASSQTHRVIAAGLEKGVLVKMDLKIGGKLVPHYAEKKR